MFIKQISVSMQNRPGQLAEITQLLSDHAIDIRAINIADTTDFGILRMIVNDPSLAEAVLRANNMTVNITDVIAVSIDDTLGAFSTMIALLKDKEISIEYIYSFIGEKSSKAVMVLKTDFPERSIAILKQGGVCVLSNEDSSGMHDEK